MGTGKTSVGMRVARSLGFRFVDTDKLIAKEYGVPIPKIFEEFGEEHFRETETRVLSRCAEGAGQVISTGGGIVNRDANIGILQSSGYVIWLKAAPEVIYERVKRNRSRPLLRTPDPLATIRELLAVRNERYERCAHLAIATDHLTMEETCFGVTESAMLVFGDDAEPGGESPESP